MGNQQVVQANPMTRRTLNLIGRTIGDFQVEALIGVGGVGKVFQAVQVSLQRRVALKILSPALFGSEECRVRFLREAKFLASLEHPNIVPVYGAGCEGELLYYGMRLIEGETIDRAVSDGLPMSTGLRYMADVAGALAYAHARSGVHRDVKPANILVADGTVMLADFGLARLIQESTITQYGTYVGTPIYFSPEQARLERATFKSDIYALGVTMYELLTGTHPFRFATDTRALLTAISSNAYATPRAVRPEVPLFVEEILLDTLEKDPRKRPDGHELRQALLAASRRCPRSLEMGKVDVIGNAGTTQWFGSTMGY